LFRRIMRPSQSSHPCAVSMTISPFSSWRAWQSLSLQQEIGYQSWASTRVGAKARKASASGHARTQVIPTSLVVADKDLAEANVRARLASHMRRKAVSIIRRTMSTGRECRQSLWRDICWTQRRQRKGSSMLKGQTKQPLGLVNILIMRVVEQLPRRAATASSAIRSLWR
jgi:hypothetical protein